MSRVANNPVSMPAGVEVIVGADAVTVKSGKNELRHALMPGVAVVVKDGVVGVSAADDDDVKMAGTMRAHIHNMVVGVSKGFERQLKLVGVGYRASVKGQVLNLSLGFSHPVEFAIPAGVTIETPSATDITIKGASKQVVGQVAADIRAFRPPEPYKGKGVRYADERIVMKEAKKA